MDCRDMILNIAGFLPASMANGPGVRAVVWVQGCPRRCPGCWNPETLPFVRRREVNVNELTAAILAVPGIEGLTLSGGEPFSQARPLAALARSVRAAGLNVITFTGHVHEHLASAGDRDWSALLEATDVLVDGPYVRELRCDEPMRGSSNQRVIFLSEALRGHSYFQREAGQSFEIQISTDGSVTTTGFPAVSPDEFRRRMTLYGVELAPLEERSAR